MTTRTSRAEWRGPVPRGEGSVKLGSGSFEGRYSFASRFGQANDRSRKALSPPAIHNLPRR